MKRFLLGFVLAGMSAFVCLRYYSSRGPTGSLDDQMIGALQEYIRIDTTHPKPDYTAALQFLKTMAQSDGFDFKEVKLPSGNSVGVITFLGSDQTLPSLVLNHHMDVVPAENASEWKEHPFQAKIVDGQLIGRGVQDMKGIGMVHYFALKALKENGFKPKRTIHVFAVPDEEVGGFKGTKEFVQSDTFKNLNVGFVVDEGHASGVENTFDIKVSERKPIQVIVSGKGSLAHGSHLQDFNIAHELIQFLTFITDLHAQNQIQAEHEPAGKLLSLNISSLTAGMRKPDGSVAFNMIPGDAQATIDIRVPPTMKKKAVIALFEKQLELFSNLTYTIAAQADEEPGFKDMQSLLYRELAGVIESFGYTVQPHYFEASSDLRFYLAQEIDSVGLTPFTVIDNIHGTDEAVPITQLIEARKMMTAFVKRFTS